MNDNLVATATVRVAAGPDDVWRAITDPELVARYYFGTTLESDWEPGSPITWTGEYEGTRYHDHGTVLEVVPRERLVHTHFSPLTGREDVPENYHTLTWTLKEQPGATEFTLSQDNNASAGEAEHSKGMWDSLVAGVKKVAERE